MDRKRDKKQEKRQEGKKKRSPVAVICSALGTVLLAGLVVFCLPLTVPRALG